MVSLNDYMDKSRVCVTCGKATAITPRVPWGKYECENCRARTGRCLMCGVNRNDCCC